MRLLIAVLSPFLVEAAACGAEHQGGFAGEWKTTMGPVSFEQTGGEVTGKIVFYKLPLECKVKDKTLNVGYDEGQIHVDAKLELEPSGNSFKGTFQASNGNRGVWNGWRPVPGATQAKPADFTGLWLTDLGLMELTSEGSKVKGRYAFRGTSSLDGEVKGRHLEFHIKAFRTGPGWFDLDEKGTSLAGAGAPTACPAGTAGTAAKPPSLLATYRSSRARSFKDRPATC